MIHILHISDLHLVTDPQWNNMKEAILNSVHDKLNGISLGQKLLIVTGDFHNFKQNDYTYAKIFLTQLIGAMEIEPQNDVFVVPGNHDIFVPDAQQKNRAFMIKAIKSEPTMLQDGLEQLLTYFEPYTQFIQSLKIYPQADAIPASVHVRTWRNKLNILHLNTALIADGTCKDNQMADTLSATSENIRLQLRNGSLPAIAIAHNSFYDLLPEHQTQISAMFLQENIHAYLCGDRHHRNSQREENLIFLKSKFSTVTIPNIVAYRGSTDEHDTYSDFGIIWQQWDEDTGRVDLEYMKWDPKDQAELQPDGTDNFALRNTAEKPMKITISKQESSCWETNEIILEKKKYPLEKFHIKKFLQGAPCRWNLAFSDQIVHRDITDQLYKHAHNGGIYVLVGAGGEGKTTILQQLCAKLILDKIPVFYYQGFGKLRLPDNVPEHAVFVLDNPPDNTKFKNFLNVVVSNNITLILGARQNEWNLLKLSCDVSDRDITEIPLPTLTPKECWHFADCVLNHVHTALTKKEIKEIFQNNSYGFLYAAMLMVINNKDSLEEIASEIVKNLAKRSKQSTLLLAHIVLSEYYGVKFYKSQLNYICNDLKISKKEGMKALSREVSLNGQIYQTRHEIISKLFYNELFYDSGLLSLNDVDRILENLLTYHFKSYQESFARFKYNSRNAIILLSGALSQTSLTMQKFLINRILDEFKLEPPKMINSLLLHFKNDEIQMLYYKLSFDRNYITPANLIKWCNLLFKNGANWDIDELYSPAWILKTACMKDDSNSSVWLHWIHLEKKYNQIGNYQMENTARWICREACLKYSADSSVWLAWIQLEVNLNQIGDYCTENTARWICREACRNHSVNSSVWLAWIRLEKEQDRIGDYHTENTARWICREACLNHSVDSSVWLAWILLEKEQDQIGNYHIENTARWICREACLNHSVNSSIWLAWTHLETQQNQIGDYLTANTARWICCQACLDYAADSTVWLAWVNLELQQNQIGDYHTENTVRWICRQACLNYTVDSPVWLAWAQLETQENQIGNIETENSARWIYAKGIELTPQSLLYLPYAHMELSQHVPDQARYILHQSLLYHDHTIGPLAILEFFYGNINSDNLYCTKKLMEQLDQKEEKGFTNLLYLYHCSRLLEQSGNADRYYQLIRNHPDYDPENTYVEQWIQLCRECEAIMEEEENSAMEDI